jgi:hypothetical protein
MSWFRRVKPTALVVGVVLVVVGLGGALAWPTRARASNPFASARPMHDTLRGHVVERQDVGSYVYLRIVDEHGAARWVVTLRLRLTTSEDVIATVLAYADRFTSPRLHRTFSPLYFGTVRAAPSLNLDEKEMQ